MATPDRVTISTGPSSSDPERAEAPSDFGPCGSSDLPHAVRTIPPALARWIAAQGHQGTHVFDLALQAADDGPIWEHARREKAVIVSKDEDFVDRWLLSDRPVALIWIRKGNCSNQALLAWLEPLWPDIVMRLEQGEQLIELRA